MWKEQWWNYCEIEKPLKVCGRWESDLELNGNWSTSWPNWMVSCEKKLLISWKSLAIWCRQSKREGEVLENKGKIEPK